MKRLELFEFEDYKWLPSTIRSGATSLIIVFHRLMGTSEVLTSLLLKLHKKLDFSQVVDLGSGSGGPMLEVINNLNKTLPDKDIKLILSDYSPNPEIVNNINQQDPSIIQYLDHSVDARDIDDAPDGIKTMIASFHHMPPSAARSILASAKKSQQPILIYEIALNNIPVLLWWLLLPLSLAILIVMSLLLTPFVRPLSFKQLLFTYLIPIIPIVYAWDGQASLMRTYTFDDIRELLPKSEQNSAYTWEIEIAKKVNGKKAGYYILGMPTS